MNSAENQSPAPEELVVVRVRKGLFMSMAENNAYDYVEMLELEIDLKIMHLNEREKGGHLCQINPVKERNNLAVYDYWWFGLQGAWTPFIFMRQGG